MADKLLQEATQKVTMLQEHVWGLQVLIDKCIGDQEEVNWWSEMTRMKEVLVLAEKDVGELSQDLDIMGVYVTPVGNDDSDLNQQGKRACKYNSDELKEKKKEFFEKEWEGSMMLRIHVSCNHLDSSKLGASSAGGYRLPHRRLPVRHTHTTRLPNTGWAFAIYDIDFVDIGMGGVPSQIEGVYLNYAQATSVLARCYDIEPERGYKLRTFQQGADTAVQWLEYFSIFATNGVWFPTDDMINAYFEKVQAFKDIWATSCACELKGDAAIASPVQKSC